MCILYEESQITRQKRDFIVTLKENTSQQATKCDIKSVVMTFTLQEIAKELELTIRTTINSHLVYQNRQIPTGHLQHDIACMWLQCNSNTKYKMQCEKKNILMFTVPVSCAAPLQSLMQRHSYIQCALTRNPPVQNRRNSAVCYHTHISS